MTSTQAIASSFIEGAPPGELNDVVSGIKALTSDNDPSVIDKIKPAFEKYHEDQLTCVKLPGAAQPVLISQYNKTGPNTYYDASSSTSFTFNATTCKASSPQSYVHESPNAELITSTLKSLSSHFSEHYPLSANSAYTVCASPSSSSEIAILISATKASPSNFLSGRWRTSIVYDTGSKSLSGKIRVQVHYYEDGNVSLNTEKEVVETGVGASGPEIVRKIAAVEKAYQEELNRALVSMNEGAFKSLRRQLPVTRQKVEWERVRGYNLGGDLKGEAKR